MISICQNGAALMEMIKARAVLLSCEELSPQLFLLLRSPLCGGPAASPLACGVRRSRGFGGGGFSESRKVRGSESVLKLIRSPTASGSGRCVRDEALGGGIGGCCSSTQRPRATDASRAALSSRARCVLLPRHTGLGELHGDEPPSSLSEPSETHRDTFTYIHRAGQSYFTSSHSHIINRVKVKCTQSTPPTG